MTELQLSYTGTTEEC